MNEHASPSYANTCYGKNRNFTQAYFLLCLLLLTLLQATAQNGKSSGAGFELPDTLLFKIQKAQAVVTEVDAQNKKGYGIVRSRKVLADAKTNTDPINTDIQTSGELVDSKTLEGYSIILNDEQSKLNSMRTSMSAASNDLQHNLAEIVTLSSDSLLMISAGDTSSKKLYAAQLISLRLQLQNAGTLTTGKLDTVNQLLATVSATYLTVTNLQSDIANELEKRGNFVLQKEVPYLWQAPLSVSGSGAKELIRSTYTGQNKILNYFLASTWDNRILLFFLTIIFFLWVYRNYKKWQVQSVTQATAEPGTHLPTDKPEFKVIHKIPVLAALLFLLNLVPLFNPGSPAVYIVLDQFLLMIVLVIYLRKQLSKTDFRAWIIFTVSYIIFLLIAPVINISLFPRLCLIVLNISFLTFGIVIRRKLATAKMSFAFIKPVITLCIILLTASLALNIFGGISLAKSLCVTAVIALTQVIGLMGFVHIMIESFELQVLASSSSKSIFSRINLEHTRRSVKRLFSWLAIIIWCIVFFINLGVSTRLFAFLDTLLSRQHAFGSFTFTISNILFFAAIIYVSSVLERNVGLLFGESSLSMPSREVAHKSSKLSLMRLVIIIGGFLLAIAASGISLTKITVVLGALSVGIGLGMQNIVSNFVSGIILIFEKPFQIGDFVELGDKKGRIEDIGIRSSKMLTLQGSQVIVPNGDFLSNRLTNWTSNNPYMKTELTFKVAADTNMGELSKLIEENMQQTDGILKNTPSEILIDSIAADSLQLRVLFWITNLYSEASLKSTILQKLLINCKEKGIKVL